MKTEIERLVETARTNRRLPPAAERRRLRQAGGIAQQAVADALGVSRPTVTRWETGAREPAGRFRAAYVELLEALARPESS